MCIRVCNTSVSRCNISVPRCSVSVSRCNTRGCSMMGTIRYSLKMQHKEVHHDDMVQQHDVCSMMMKSNKMGTT